MKRIAVGNKYGELTVVGRAPDFLSNFGKHIPIWICECDKHHHKIEYRAESVYNGKCPYCSNDRLLVGFNDLSTLYPDLSEEWDYEKNGELKPSQFTPRSHKKIWWKCKKCGDSWLTEIYVRVKGHGCPYCANKKASSKNNLATVAPDLAAEWNYERNGTLTPKDVAPNSPKAVWWRCSRGHEWKAKVQNRYLGRGCRICSAELKSSFPEQAIRYYLSKYFKTESRFRIENWEVDIFLPDLNIGIEYDGLAWHLTSEKLIDREMRKNDFIKKSSIKLIRVKETKSIQEDNNSTIFLNISKNGYVYSQLDNAIIRLLILLTGKKESAFNINHQRDRTDILSSYIKLTKENNLETEVKEATIFWDYEKNKELQPNQFTRNSNHVVWWKCPTCGGSWEKSIIAFSKGDRCPYCSGHRLLPGFNDLETMFPEVANEWNYEKNGNMTPANTYARSSKRLWWVCAKGHEWQQTLSARISKHTGCPYCSGKAYLFGPNAKQVEEWDKKFEEARQYFDNHGNLEVPIGYISDSGLKLGVWIQSQRTKCNNGNLLPDRKQRLDSIGMIWNVKRGPKK